MVVGGGVGCAIAYPSAKAFKAAGVETDVIVGFRIPYITGPDTEPLDNKIRNLEMFAENVITKVNG